MVKVAHVEGRTYPFPFYNTALHTAPGGKSYTVSGPETMLQSLEELKEK